MGGLLSIGGTLEMPWYRGAVFSLYVRAYFVSLPTGYAGMSALAVALCVLALFGLSLCVLDHFSQT